MFGVLDKVLMQSVTKCMHEKNNKSDLHLETKTTHPSHLTEYLSSVLETVPNKLYSEVDRQHNFGT